MKKVLLSSLALLFLVTGCTKPASKEEDDDEPQEIQIEEETEIEIDEGEVSGGL